MSYCINRAVSISSDPFAPFAVTYLARHLKADAESALENTTKKFSRRFRAVESGAKSQGRNLKDMTLAEMDALWEEAKSAEN